ncbi:unnamed protein product [Pleuronectes platessa]|uniref:Uncharacterized protein n=1 Tax=Pleuronectes platessa TaxID=8262 RepID=A0A9N7V0G9_PLEPL|nr:unnamed protein product [Pleuronectes platessa]
MAPAARSSLQRILTVTTSWDLNSKLFTLPDSRYNRGSAPHEFGRNASAGFHHNKPTSPQKTNTDTQHLCVNGVTPPDALSERNESISRQLVGRETSESEGFSNELEKKLKDTFIIIQEWISRRFHPEPERLSRWVQCRSFDRVVLLLPPGGAAAAGGRDSTEQNIMKKTTGEEEPQAAL